MITDKEIEDYGYRDNSEYSSTDQIETWIAGAKWYRDMTINRISPWIEWTQITIEQAKLLNTVLYDKIMLRFDNGKEVLLSQEFPKAKITHIKFL